MADQPQTPPPQPPYGYYPPPPGYPPPYYQQPQQQPQPTLFERLPWKWRIIIGLVLLAFVFITMMESCQSAMQTTAARGTPANTVYPANPQSIESERNAAQRALEDAQRLEEEAKRRALNGPVLPKQAASSTANGTATQDPDAQFWHQIRQDKWKREAEAPYAPGVGWVTRRPSGDSSKQASETQSPDAIAYRDVLARLAGQQQQNGAATTQQQAVQPQPNTGTDREQEHRQEGEPSLDPTAYDFNHAEGQTHRLMEGTILESTLLNQLDGEFSGPVICQISNNVYDLSGRDLLIPSGSKAIGLAHSINSTNQRRLAVSFHRITMPDGYSLDLDKFQGLNQIGETGLVDKVNS